MTANAQIRTFRVAPRLPDSGHSFSCSRILPSRPTSSQRRPGSPSCAHQTRQRRLHGDEVAGPSLTPAFRGPLEPDETPRGPLAASCRPAKTRPHWLDIFRELRSGCQTPSRLLAKGPSWFRTALSCRRSRCALRYRGSFHALRRNKPPV